MQGMANVNGLLPAGHVRAGGHLGKGLLAAMGSICGYSAIAALPLGDATALFFVAPVVVTAGTAFLLREHAGVVRSICIASSFVGVLMIAQPHFGSTLGVLAGLGNAVCAALGVLLVRRVRNTEGALALALTTSIVGTAVLVFPTFLVWISISFPEFFALAVLGVMGGLATVLLNLAYHQAPAPLLANSTIRLRRQPAGGSTRVGRLADVVGIDRRCDRGGRRVAQSGSRPHS